MKQKTAIIMSLVCLSLFVMDNIYCVYWHFDNYNRNIYPFDKKMANFDRALSTTNLGDAADYCQEIYDYIKQYSGNPNWWVYKTDRTNWDLIKKDLKSVIENANEANNNTKAGEDAYEEALTTLKDKIETTEEESTYGLREQIDKAFNYELYQKTWVMFWILMSSWIALLVVLIMLVYYY